METEKSKNREAKETEYFLESADIDKEAEKNRTCVTRKLRLKGSQKYAESPEAASQNQMKPRQSLRSARLRSRINSFIVRNAKENTNQQRKKSDSSGLEQEATIFQRGHAKTDRANDSCLLLENPKTDCTDSEQTGARKDLGCPLKNDLSNETRLNTATLENRDMIIGASSYDKEHNIHTEQYINMNKNYNCHMEPPEVDVTKDTEEDMTVDYMKCSSKYGIRSDFNIEETNVIKAELENPSECANTLNKGMYKRQQDSKDLSLTIERSDNIESSQTSSDFEQIMDADLNEMVVSSTASTELLPCTKQTKSCEVKTVPKKSITLYTLGTEGHYSAQSSKGVIMAPELAAGSNELNCKVVETDNICDINGSSKTDAGTYTVIEYNTHIQQGSGDFAENESRHTFCIDGHDKQKHSERNIGLSAKALIPIKSIPAFSGSASNIPMRQEEEMRGSTANTIPSDSTLIYQPEEGILKSKPIAKSTRGRQGVRKSTTCLSGPTVYHPEVQEAAVRSQPLYHLPYQRYKLPDEPLINKPQIAFYHDVPENPWGEFELLHPDAAGDMMAYKEIRNFNPNPDSLNVSPKGRIPWYGHEGVDNTREAHDWYGSGRGRGSYRGSFGHPKMKRGSGGVRQYLQHRLLWARYTGRSQEAVDRVLSIINSNCSVKEDAAKALSVKGWGSAAVSDSIEDDAYHEGGLDTSDQDARSNKSNSILGHSNAVVDGNGYIIYLNKEDRSDFQKAPTATFTSQEAVTQDNGATTDDIVEPHSIVLKTQLMCTPANENTASNGDVDPHQQRNNSLQRMEIPVSPVKVPVKRFALPTDCILKKKVRRSLTFPSPTKQELDETRSATESIANAVTNNQDLDKTGVLPLVSSAPSHLPPTSNHFQSTGNAGISINIHVTNDTSGMGSRQEAVGKLEGSGASMMFPVPSYNVEWHRGPGLVQRPYVYHNVHAAPTANFRCSENPKNNVGYLPHDCRFPAGIDRYYTTDYGREWMSTYPPYGQEQIPTYKASVAVPSTYPPTQAWNKSADLYGRPPQQMASATHMTHERDTAYQYYQKTDVPYAMKKPFEEMETLSRIAPSQQYAPADNTAMLSKMAPVSFCGPARSEHEAYQLCNSWNSEVSRECILPLTDATLDQDEGEREGAGEPENNRAENKQRTATLFGNEERPELCEFTVEQPV